MKKIQVKGTGFIDDKGNAITPRGVNMVCKDKSRGYMGGYTSEDFAYLKSLGMNLVRLGIFWDGVEPEPGKYNEEYLRKVDEVIKLAAQNDICVFLDMHQDLYSAEFEDGAPGWATLTDGNVYTKTELWSDAYLECAAVQIAFDNFWKNAAAGDGVGLQDHYVAMWKMLSARYAAYPNVIGYDVLNEPFPGTAANGVVEALFGTVAQLLQVEDPAVVMGYFADAAKKTELFEKIGTPENLMKLVSAIEPVTGVFEETYLNPFYVKMGKAIWGNDKDAILMLENNYFSNAGIPSHVQPVKDAKGNALPNQVYAPHGYDIFVDTDMYDGSDFSRVDLIFETHRQVAAAINLPVIVGEWGCYPETLPSQLEQAKHLLGMFKNMGAGNTYYEFQQLKNKNLAETLKVN